MREMTGIAGGKQARPLPNVLLVDDDPTFCEDMQLVLRNHCRVQIAHDVAAGRHAARGDAPAVVLLDIDLGAGGDGLDLLLELQQDANAPPVVMLTQERSMEVIVRSIQLGAFHYIVKPPHPKELKGILERALAAAAENRRRRALERDFERLSSPLIAADEATLTVLEAVERVAPTDATVFLTGESGTGKELVARRLHRRSDRRDGPFVPLNCASLDSGTVNSELFGHVKGAFTGADDAHRGVFEQAEGGTLFLDEVGDCPEDSQARLLRVLEEGCVRRVGGEASISIDVRLITATSRVPTSGQVPEGMRPELFHRLHVFPIHLPPLRERPEDILPIAEAHCRRIASRMGKRIVGFTPAAREHLGRQAWPGNVRELCNVVERGVIWATGERVDLADVIGRARHPGESIAPYESAKAAVLERFRREYFSAAMEAAGGNISQAARLCGIKRQNLHRHLRALKIDAADEDA